MRVAATSGSSALEPDESLGRRQGSTVDVWVARYSRSRLSPSRRGSGLGVVISRRRPSRHDHDLERPHGHSSTSQHAGPGPCSLFAVRRKWQGDLEPCLLGIAGGEDKEVDHRRREGQGGGHAVAQILSQDQRKGACTQTRGGEVRTERGMVGELRAENGRSHLALGSQQMVIMTMMTASALYRATGTR